MRLTTATLTAVIIAACNSGDGDDGSTSPPDGSDGSSISLEADLAADLGKPARLLVGLGSTEQSDIAAQGITPDIYERYLVGAGQNLESGWQTWNSPEGAYVDVVAAAAD